jgi:hypothetical protein
MKHIYAVLIATVVLSSCGPNRDNTAAQVPYGNEPAKGFNLEASDEKAIELADQVMEAMGGRQAWDETRYIKWNFFGVRRLLWDKETGWVRIEDQRSDLMINVNVYQNPLAGMVSKGGELFENQDSLDYYLDRGNRIWINDSYWLVMPFKLKDSGVTLTYEAEDTLLTGETSDRLRLTFEGVGVTPENGYDVWVSRADTLVRQWAYYRDASDSIPMFINPWNDYAQYGNIMLSGNRGERDLTEIDVLENVSETIFTSFEEAIN